MFWHTQTRSLYFSIDTYQRKITIFVEADLRIMAKTSTNDSISLNDLSPASGDKRVFESSIDIQKEWTSFQQEYSRISVDKIPFSKADVVLIVISAAMGVTFDLLAFLGNSTGNIVGDAGDKFHESIDHKGNPLDFQGSVDKEGNPIINGDNTRKKVLSWGGGGHRGRTRGHDIAHYKEAIQMYEDGAFRDGGFPSGEKGSYIKVETFVNQYGNYYKKLTHEEAVKAYKRHMWADFWSPKGLPIPFTSDLVEYCTDDNINRIVAGFVKLLKPLKDIDLNLYNEIRAINAHKVREYIQQLYENGVNLRSELEKSLSLAIPECIIQIYSLIKYTIPSLRKKDNSYSKEAIRMHCHQMLLITHGVVAAVNVGTAIIAENPEHLNFATLLRVFKLGFSCIKDNNDYLNRVFSKVSYGLLKTRALELETIIAFSNGYYETNNYQRFCDSVLKETCEKISDRLFVAAYVELLLDEYEEIKNKQKDNKTISTVEIERITNKLTFAVDKGDTLETLVERSIIPTDAVSRIRITDVLKAYEEPEDID